MNKASIIVLSIFASIASLASVTLSPSSAAGYKHAVVNMPSLIQGIGMGPSEGYKVLRYEDRIFLQEAFLERAMMQAACENLGRYLADETDNFYNYQNTYGVVIKKLSIPHTYNTTYVNYNSNGSHSQFIDKDMATITVPPSGNIKPSFDDQMFEYFTGLSFSDRYTIYFDFYNVLTNQVLRAKDIEDGYKTLQSLDKIWIIRSSHTYGISVPYTSSFTKTGYSEYYRWDYDNSQWEYTYTPETYMYDTSVSEYQCQTYMYISKDYNWVTDEGEFNVSPMYKTEYSVIGIPTYQSATSNKPNARICKLLEIEHGGYSASQSLSKDIYCVFSISDSIDERKANGDHITTNSTRYIMLGGLGTQTFSLDYQENKLYCGVLFSTGDYLYRIDPLDFITCEDPQFPSGPYDQNYHSTSKSHTRTIKVEYTVVITKPKYHAKFQ